MARGQGGLFEQIELAEQLLNQGDLSKAWQVAESFEDAEVVSDDERFTVTLLQSQILAKKGEYNDSLRLAEQALAQSQELGNVLKEIDAYIAIAVALSKLGKHDEGLSIIDQGEQQLAKVAGESAEKVTKRKALLKFHRGDILINKDDCGQAFIYLDQSLALHRDLNEKLGIARALHAIGSIHCFRGQPDKALPYFEECYSHFGEAGNKKGASLALHCMSAMCSSKGELDRALEYENRSLALREELGSKDDIAHSFNAISVILRKKGELDQALAYYEESYSFYKEVDNKIHIAWTLDSIGEVLCLKGELDSALEHIEQSLALRKELGSKEAIAESLFHLSRILHQKGDLDQALKHLEQVLIYAQERDHDLWIANTLFDMVCVLLDKGAFEQAQQYLEKLAQVNARVDNKIINQWFRLAKASLLTSSFRIREKAKAQEIYHEIVEDEIVDHQLTVLAMVNLCESLLDELKAYGDPTALQEAKNLGDRLSVLACQQHSHSLAVNALILQSKFAMVEGNLIEASKFLDQAKSMADAKNLGLLSRKATSEKAQLEAEYDSWQNLIFSNAPFQQRLEQARLQEHLKDALKLVQMAESKSQVKEKDHLGVCE